jgi:hypothetical protein
MRILRALAKEGLAPRRSRGKLVNKGWCGQPWHAATRPAVRGLPAPRGRPYAASSGGEVSTQTGFALSSETAAYPERRYLQVRRCEMRQQRRIAAETAHRFRRDQDLAIVRGAESPNGRAIEDHPLRAERPRSAASPAGENKGMIDTESLDRLEPAPGSLMVGQVQRNARIEIVRVERGALPIREGTVALDGCTKAGKEVRRQRSADADRDRSVIGLVELRCW